MTDELPQPKPDHTGIAAPPFGPHVYLIVRDDGKMCGIEKSRHDAAWAIWNFHGANEYDVRYVPVGCVPLVDLAIPDGWKK